MTMIKCVLPCVLGFLACTDVSNGVPLSAESRAQPTSTPSSESKEKVEDPAKPRGPEECRDRDYREWLFEPSETPISPRPINPRNSAARVHRLRDQITRVEIAHEYTYARLFDLNQAGLSELREIPDWPPVQLRKKSRPAGGKDWPVVFLIYLANEELPYLGHPFNGELYFAEDDDPWHFYVLANDGEFRELYPMPMGDDIYRVLESELGLPDPGGVRAAQAKIEDDIRCGVSRPSRPDQASASPGVPRARVGD